MKEEYKNRFKDAPWASFKEEIIVGGAGGTGSWTSLLLARAGHSLIIYDYDYYDATNIAGQFMKPADINKSKVSALKQNIIDFCGEEASIDAICEKYTEESMITPIMISCFDSMEARKIFFENWASQEDRQIFIDTRQNAENRDVFFVLKGDEDEYRKHLFSDDSLTYEVPCSYKATSHTGAGTAELVLCGLNNYLSNIKFSEDNNGIYEDIRRVPFKISDDLTQINREIICLKKVVLTI